MSGWERAVADPALSHKERDAGQLPGQGREQPHSLHQVSAQACIVACHFLLINKQLMLPYTDPMCVANKQVKQKLIH